MMVLPFVVGQPLAYPMSLVNAIDAPLSLVGDVVTLPVVLARQRQRPGPAQQADGADETTPITPPPVMPEKQDGR
jgi:hypothetical protein